MDLVYSEIPKCMCCGCWDVGAALFHFPGSLAVLSSLSSGKGAWSWVLYMWEERSDSNCLCFSGIFPSNGMWSVGWGRSSPCCSLDTFYCLTSLLIAALWDPGKTSMLNHLILILSGGNKLLPILGLHQLCKAFCFAQVQFFLQMWRDNHIPAFLSSFQPTMNLLLLSCLVCFFLWFSSLNKFLPECPVRGTVN